MRGDLGLQKQTLNLYIGSFNIYKKKEAQKPKRKYDKKKGKKKSHKEMEREEKTRESGSLPIPATRINTDGEIINSAGGW